MEARSSAPDDVCLPNKSASRKRVLGSLLEPRCDDLGDGKVVRLSESLDGYPQSLHRHSSAHLEDIRNQETDYSNRQQSFDKPHHQGRQQIPHSSERSPPRYDNTNHGTATHSESPDSHHDGTSPQSIQHHSSLYKPHQFDNKLSHHDKQMPYLARSEPVHFNQKESRRLLFADQEDGVPGNDASSLSPLVEVNGIRVLLEDADLWQTFYRCGTEMIINRPGRRMFPSIAVSVSGLDPSATYKMILEVVPADERRYKYVNNHWMPVGKADPTIRNSPYVHPDSPSRGRLWMQTKISFSKIKITNNRESEEGNVLLHSMHKYMAHITIIKLALEPGSHDVTHVFPIPLTSFIAVTAYQSENITQMKIRNNPFAKAFRDNDFPHVMPHSERSLLEAHSSHLLSHTGSSPIKRLPASRHLPDSMISALGLPLSLSRGTSSVAHMPHPLAYPSGMYPIPYHLPPPKGATTSALLGHAYPGSPQVGIPHPGMMFFQPWLTGLPQGMISEGIPQGMSSSERNEAVYRWLAACAENVQSAHLQAVIPQRFPSTSPPSSYPGVDQSRHASPNQRQSYSPNFTNQRSTPRGSINAESEPRSRCSPHDIYNRTPNNTESEPKNRCSPHDIYNRASNNTESEHKSRCSPHDIYNRTSNNAESEPKSRCSPHDIYNRTSNNTESEPKSRCSPHDIYNRTSNNAESEPKSRCSPHDIYNRTPNNTESEPKSRCSPHDIYNRTSNNAESEPKNRCLPLDFYNRTTNNTESEHKSRCSPHDIYSRTSLQLNDADIKKHMGGSITVETKHGRNLPRGLIIIQPDPSH